MMNKVQWSLLFYETMLFNSVVKHNLYNEVPDLTFNSAVADSHHHFRYALIYFSVAQLFIIAHEICYKLNFPQHLLLLPWKLNLFWNFSGMKMLRCTKHSEALTVFILLVHKPWTAQHFIMFVIKAATYIFNNLHFNTTFVSGIHSVKINVFLDDFKGFTCQESRDQIHFF